MLRGWLARFHDELVRSGGFVFYVLATAEPIYGKADSLV